MIEELKIKIRDFKDVEEHLVRQGAKFVREIDVVDTYFKQPAGEVLKVTEDDSGNYLVNLKSKDGKFEILKYEPIKEVGKLKRDLSEKFGLKCVVEKKRRFFTFGIYEVNINLIRDVGEFLILEGGNLSKRIIIEELKIANPEFVTASFDELKEASM